MTDSEKGNGQKKIKSLMELTHENMPGVSLEGNRVGFEIGRVLYVNIESSTIWVNYQMYLKKAEELARIYSKKTGEEFRVREEY